MSYIFELADDTGQWVVFKQENDHSKCTLYDRFLIIYHKYHHLSSIFPTVRFSRTHYFGDYHFLLTSLYLPLIARGEL